MGEGGREVVRVGCGGGREGGSMEGGREVVWVGREGGR